MKVKTIAKINGAFLACLMAVVLLLAHERTVGVLTPRELSIALIVYTVGSSIVLLSWSLRFFGHSLRRQLHIV